MLLAINILMDGASVTALGDAIAAGISIAYLRPLTFILKGASTGSAFITLPESLVMTGTPSLSMKMSMISQPFVPMPSWISRKRIASD